MMKAFALVLGLCVAVVSGPVHASPSGTLIGAALGAGGALIAANNVDHVDAAWAVPAGIIVGGILGNQVEKWMDGRKGDRARPEQKPQFDPSAIVDSHPGVDLIKVSILNSNGVRSDVSILRLGDRFVGPQGESYEALPSSDILARRYGM